MCSLQGEGHLTNRQRYIWRERETSLFLHELVDRKPEQVGPYQPLVTPIFDSANMDSRVNFSNLTTMNNSAFRVRRNPMSKIWKKSTSLKSAIARMCSDHMQSTEIVVVQVLCSMEDERIFSTSIFSSLSCRIA